MFDDTATRVGSLRFFHGIAFSDVRSEASETAGRRFGVSERFHQDWQLDVQDKACERVALS